ncbi:hypothetical protein [Parvibaculum sp. MBR-TMA-1.3b-4.2]|jgi:hypothetical protein
MAAGTAAVVIAIVGLPNSLIVAGAKFAKFGYHLIGRWARVFKHFLIRTLQFLVYICIVGLALRLLWWGVGPLNAPFLDGVEEGAIKSPLTIEYVVLTALLILVGLAIILLFRNTLQLLIKIFRNLRKRESPPSGWSSQRPTHRAFQFLTSIAIAGVCLWLFWWVYEYSRSNYPLTDSILPPTFSRYFVQYGVFTALSSILFAGIAVWFLARIFGVAVWLVSSFSGVADDILQKMNWRHVCLLAATLLSVCVAVSLLWICEPSELCRDIANWLLIAIFCLATISLVEVEKVRDGGWSLKLLNLSIASSDDETTSILSVSLGSKNTNTKSIGSASILSESRHSSEILSASALSKSNDSIAVGAVDIAAKNEKTYSILSFSVLSISVLSVSVLSAAIGSFVIFGCSVFDEECSFDFSNTPSDRQSSAAPANSDQGIPVPVKERGSVTVDSSIVSNLLSSPMYWRSNSALELRGSRGEKVDLDSIQIEHAKLCSFKFAVVIGMATPGGTKLYNFRLSQKRKMSIARFLQNKIKSCGRDIQIIAASIGEGVITAKPLKRPRVLGFGVLQSEKQISSIELTALIADFLRTEIEAELDSTSLSPEYCLYERTLNDEPSARFHDFDICREGW